MTKRRGRSKPSGLVIPGCAHPVGCVTSGGHCCACDESRAADLLWRLLKVGSKVQELIWLRAKAECESGMMPGAPCRSHVLDSIRRTLGP